jgi:hypothetical protein
MAIVAPFMPLLAMMSGEARALPRDMADSAREARLMAMADQDAGGAPAPAVDAVLDADEALIDGRRRPGRARKLPERVTQHNLDAVSPPPPEAFPTQDFPVPDRWRLALAACPGGALEKVGQVYPVYLNLCHSTRDPYHQNVLKGDRPICIPTEEEQAHRAEAGIPRCITPKFLGLKHDDWFFVATAVSDTIFEARSFPTPQGVQTTSRPGSLDVFGRAQSIVAAQTFIFGADLFKGSTSFKPPEIEYKIALAYNVTYVDVSERRILDVRPSIHSHRYSNFLGVQEFFVDYHIRNTSDRYDFESIRVGIQPFQADFRGFLFNDQQLGIRFFGNRDNNRWQFNAAAFWRLEKDTNSGLNSVVKSPRADYVFTGNVYRQDFPVVGMTSQISLTYNMNRERNRAETDKNGFPVRPALLGDLRGRNYDVVYLGYAADGHFGRLNLTAQAYAALGRDRNSFFTSKPANIRAFFLAAEPSFDTDWARFRLSALYASGDGKPYDNTESGFDAIFENPVFAGADTSYWIRQTIPFAGGGRAIAINGRNGILNSLRSSKEQGQSNFNNPGTILLGAGADFDLTPQLRLSTNVNHLWFANTATLQALRVEGSIPRAIGYDVSASTIYRPKAIQNVVFRLSGALLAPGKGFRDLFTTSRRDARYYSVLFNATVTF